MYVKIRTDGAVGIGRGTESKAEITLGYGEAHMIAAALDKLAQTARSYKQTYKKTTDVGTGNKIDFERTESGSIILTGDGHRYMLTEKEVKVLSEKLKSLPPVEVAVASDYVQKVTPQGGMSVKISNGGHSTSVSLAEAAILKTSVLSSLNSRFYDDETQIGQRVLKVGRTSDLKWHVGVNDQVVRFTAYEIEALVGGLHNGILDVLMDTVKAMGSDDIADIRVKSAIQRIEQDATKLMEDVRGGKSIVRELVKRTKRILGTAEDAESRADRFIDLCKYVSMNLDPAHMEPLFDLFSKTFVGEA